MANNKHVLDSGLLNSLDAALGGEYVCEYHESHTGEIAFLVAMNKDMEAHILAVWDNNKSNRADCPTCEVEDWIRDFCAGAAMHKYYYDKPPRPGCGDLERCSSVGYFVRHNIPFVCPTYVG